MNRSDPNLGARSASGSTGLRHPSWEYSVGEPVRNDRQVAVRYPCVWL